MDKIHIGHFIAAMKIVAVFFVRWLTPKLWS